MPCRCDYMEPNDREIEYSKVLTLLDELDGKPINPDYFRGYHPQAYGAPLQQADLDRATQRLCTCLRAGKVDMLSLEMQMWWRDHQQADRRHKREGRARKAKQAARGLALAKLTLDDRKALGL